MSNDTKSITPVEGISICGRILRRERKTGTNKNGQPFTIISYMVICGSEIIKVNQNDTDSGEFHPEGSLITIRPTPSYKDNGVLLMNGDIKMAS